MAREIEIKIRIDRVETATQLLDRHGFTILHERVFERNRIFDTTDGELRARGELLRVREAGTRGLLTFKGGGQAGRYKSREELETPVDKPGVLVEILQRLAFSQVFVYEKYRTEYARPDRAGVVTVDETPIGFFLELEGPENWIDETARQFGFGESDYVTDSYGRLYLAYRENHPEAPAHMTFEPAAGRDSGARIE